MPKPNVTVRFIIEATVYPDFLEWLATDKQVASTITRALKEHNVLRESEVVSSVSVEQKGE